MLARVLRLSLLYFFSLCSILQAAAQEWSEDGPTASCLPNTLQWSFNSLNQSPCVIAEFLLNACSINGASIHIPPIQRNDLGYTVSSPTGCSCNSVFYSLLSACALCQGGNLRKWSDYSVNCSSPTFVTLPEGVPDGTRIPHYAFHDVLSPNGFNVTSFQTDSDLPEVTSNVSLAHQLAPSTTFSTTTIATGTITSQTTIIQTTGQPEVNPSSAPRSAAFSTGDIVGTVIGTLGVLLAMVAGLVWWHTRRRSLHAQTETDTESPSGADEDAGENKSSMSLEADTLSGSSRSESHSMTPQQDIDPIPLVVSLRKVKKSAGLGFSPKKSRPVTDAPPPYQD